MNSREQQVTAPARVDFAAKTKLRAGIVGAGLMGRWHAYAIQRSGAEVVAVADPDIASAQSLAAKYPKAKAFSSLEEMLTVRNLDVLHVCSPTDTHASISETGIKAGVHLLVEKPIAITADETMRLYGLAAKDGARLCPVHQFPFQNGVEKAVRNMPSIGDLTHLEANICSAGGGGVDHPEHLDSIAVSILPHPLSLIQKFIDHNISAIQWSILRPANGEIRISGQINRISISISISMNSRPTLNTFRLNGTRGTIHIDLFHGYSFIESGQTSRMTKLTHPFTLAMKSFAAAATNLSRRTLRREPAYPGLQQLVQQFYHSIKFKTPIPIDPSDTIAIAEVCDLLIAQAGIKQYSESFGK
ncbi:MAG: Gfo/Idh/MocA family oxidoreductase [Pyrinomonadaceae bacterium]